MKIAWSHGHVWLIDVTSCQQINNNEASSNPVDEITSNDICGINPSNYTADFPLEVDSPHISQTTSNTVSPSSESKLQDLKEHIHNSTLVLINLEPILLPLLRIPLPQ